MFGNGSAPVEVAKDAITNAARACVWAAAYATFRTVTGNASMCGSKAAARAAGEDPLPAVASWRSEAKTPNPSMHTGCCPSCPGSLSKASLTLSSCSCGRYVATPFRAETACLAGMLSNIFLSTLADAIICARCWPMKLSVCSSLAVEALRAMDTTVRWARCRTAGRGSAMKPTTGLVTFRFGRESASNAISASAAKQLRDCFTRSSFSGFLRTTVTEFMTSFRWP
mmetsp:Transcript_18839/g.43808  ORF Transcript_18839/g.43808 Transcript_18839/m.43808 type:complete len:226 (+) Transcript_18839:3207-3884(+)